ncbi:MAG: M1 family metallopeptidase [Solirubrobacterales bacterium]|nr:M1 family metallopeptidase [Solirubrobacterales bacterium]
MNRPTSAARGAIALSVLTALLAFAAPASAGFSPGAKTLGDPIIPQVGNGGYDVKKYEIDLSYDPVTNRFLAGTKTLIVAKATQGLSRFSLDFQRDLAIDGVEVDGADASYSRADAKPKLSSNPEVTQPAKLTIKPPTGLARGSKFSVVVAYHGEPKAIVDADTSFEGWVQACSSPGDCDGSFTVNEPIGAQSWFPANNHPSDKAKLRLATTAPAAYTAIGSGKQVSRVDNGDGTATTTWAENKPMATYLATGTVGRFDVEQGTMTDHTDGTEIPTFTAIDSAGPQQRKDEVATAAMRIPEMVNFLARKFGSYPFETVGLVADWVPAVGYALENQTKPHFSGDEEGPQVDDSTLAHELSHQWMGDSISPANWSTIWFNEGWATFSEVLFDNKVDGAEMTPRKFFKAVYEIKPKYWKIAPAKLDGDPANLFDGVAVYNRPGAMLEGLREIIGNKRFFAFAHDLNDRHGYGNISRGEFVGEAKRASGLHGGKLKRLGRYLRQWLLWQKRPHLTPSDF